MSVSYEVTLWCERCEVWAQFNHSDSHGGSVRQARARAKSLGWSSARGHDYCPVCTREGWEKK